MYLTRIHCGRDDNAGGLRRGRRRGGRWLVNLLRELIQLSLEAAVVVRQVLRHRAGAAADVVGDGTIVRVEEELSGF